MTIVASLFGGVFSSQAYNESFSFFPERTKPSIIERMLEVGSRDLAASIGRLADDTHFAYREFQREQKRNPAHTVVLRSLRGFLLGL